MANQISVNSGSQDISLEVTSPRQITVNAETQTVDVVIQSRGNIDLVLSRAVSPGIQQIIAGNNITISPTNGTGVVTINSVPTGNVSNANYATYSGTANVANSVLVANVVGIGNIATVNLDGNSANILFGNGVFASAPNVSAANTANYANYANFAGTAFSVSGSNVSGVVANATYAVTSGSADSATTANTVTDNAQPNITSVGTLTGLVVGGNITPNANVTYNLGNNTNRFKDLYLSGTTIYLGDTQLTSTGNTVTLPNANITTDLFVGGNTTITGNLTVSGNTQYTNVNNLYIKDPLIEIGGGANNAPLTNNDGKDRGELLHYYTTQPVDAFMGWDNSNAEFAFGSNVTNSGEVITFNTLGNVRAQHIFANINAANVIGTVANANYSAYSGVAGSANSVAGANVSGAVAYATTANSVAGANVSGTVANATYATSAGSAGTVTVPGSNTQVLFNDNGSLGANSNFTFNKTISPNGQLRVGQLAVDLQGSNYVYLGSLGGGDILMSGKISINPSTSNINSNLGNLVTANYFSGNGSLLTGITATASLPISSGNSNINIVANANINFSVTGTANVMTVSSTSANVNGNVQASRFISNVATGTAPFTVTSTTTVANLAAATATTAGTVTTGLQPNINSLTNTSLTVYSSSYAGTGTRNLLFTQGANTDASLQYATGITANASNSSITATTFVGALSGTASSATVAASANSVAGANVTGTVANATNATSITSTVSTTTAVYPLFTSLNITGTSTVLKNTSISANLSNGALTATTFVGSLSGTASSATVAASANSVAGANVTGTVASATVAASANSVAGSNVSGAVGLATYATTANAVAGANVSGTVANATYSVTAGTAYSVSVGNVSGIGNIATLNLDGNAGNILYGNGIFAAAPSVSNAANANYANFAGTAYSVSAANISGVVNLANYATVANSVAGSNVSGAVGLATYATTANAVAGANVSGAVAFATTANAVAGANVSGAVAFATTANSVAVANVVGIGNIATTNYNGNGSQILAGNGAWISTPSTANANYANFAGTVITSAQPNITSVGTLTSLDVTGNITGNALQLRTSTGVTTANVGAMFWDATEQTVTIGMNNGVQQQVGLENYILIKASSAITNGQVVMYTGNSSGNNVLGAPADVTATGFKPSYVLGIATQDIALNGTGYITTFGQVHGLNTNAYTEGDLLYLSTSTPGAFTITEPTAPNWHIEVGTVVKKSAGNGVVQVNVVPNDKLNNLSDVNTTTPSAGQALIYTSSNTWVNGNPNIANIAYSVSGSNVSGYVANATHANVADVANSVSAANIVGTVNLANYATVANSVAGSNVSGAVAFATTANSVAGGNVSGAVNLATYATTANAVAGSNVSGTVANATYAVTAGTAYSVSAANISGTVNLSNYATVANSVAGGNVSGAVGLATYATTANAVAGSNVSGAVNLATYATTANAVAGANVSGTVANATYAVTSGTAYSVSAGNISGTINLANYATTANSVAGSNVSGTVSSATTAGTVTTNAQPNITSVGTLTSLTASGNVAGQFLQSTNSAGDEGGEILLAKAVSNTTLSGTGVTIDVYQNKLRFFEQGGSARGAYIDISAAGAGVGSNLLAGGTATTPGGSNTQIQFNNNGSFGGISTVTWNGTSLNLGSVSNINITGGTSGYVLSTNGSGNLSWVAQSGGGSTTTDFTPSFLLGGM